MASARLRKAFRYPDDSGDDGAREELDEEEQESVIMHLILQNEKRNFQYSLSFAAIPFLSTMIFLPSLLSPVSLGFSTRFFCLLSVTSLLATAYTMKYAPPLRPDPKGKGPMRNPDITMRVQSSVIPVNFAVCMLLALAYFFSSEASVGIQPFAYLVPAGSCGIALFILILAVRQVMVSVDIKPLEDLRYEFKGA
ncbi:hypothetical protein BJX99DRAFT_191186 [Aspergillus californicus]